MKHRHMNGRIFNAAEFGAYIVWNKPEMKPFVDICNGSFDDYANVLVMKQPLDVLDKWRIDYVLVGKMWPLVYLLEHTPGWQRIYGHNIAVLLRPHYHKHLRCSRSNQLTCFHRRPYRFPSQSGTRSYFRLYCSRTVLCFI